MESLYKEKILVRSKDAFPNKDAYYYKTIKSIKFLPKKIVDVLKVDIKKGEIFFWRLFGLIPLIPLQAKEDLYKFPTKIHNTFLRYGTKEEYFQLKWSYNSNYILEGNTVYTKPCVEIEFEDSINTNGGKYEAVFFDTDEKANKYFNFLRKKCKNYCNYLINK